MQDVGLPELKEEIVYTLHEYANFLWDPKIDAEYKGLLDFQFNLQLH